MGEPANQHEGIPYHIEVIFSGCACSGGQDQPTHEPLRLLQYACINHGGYLIGKLDFVQKPVTINQ